MLNTTRRKPRQPFKNKEKRLAKAFAFGRSGDWDSFEHFERWFCDGRAFRPWERTTHIWRQLLAAWREGSKEYFRPERAARAATSADGPKGDYHADDQPTHE
jgi:hypothetical protein